MNQDKQTVAELAKAELTRLWEQVDNLNRRIDYQRRLLATHCQHVTETVHVKFSENPEPTSPYAIKTYTCDLCGKLLKYSNSANNKENNG